MIRKHCFKTSTLLCVLFVFSGFSIVAQEVLLSAQELYYENLVLTGDAERSWLGYRTLSDSNPLLPNGDTGPWSNLKKPGKFSIGNSITRFYGPDIFMSYNSKAPLGQNDRLLWQGRGANMSFSAGVRFEGYGFEATLKPELAMSQNKPFDLAVPASRYQNEPYTDKAGVWGYPGVAYIDAPQRFGNDALFDWSWGDSEIRYTWKTLTAGFGTQSIWLGPARINPIMHSNNAPPYPKFDIGARPTRLLLFGKDFGTLEGRAFWGMLSESDYFDSDDTNDETLHTGLSVSYALPLQSQQLVIGLHRSMLSDWSDRDTSAIFTLMWPFMKSDAGFDEADQRASITVNYLIPTVGLELYTEWARNDYSSNLESLVRYPFHSHAFTIGGRKSIPLWRSDLRAELLIEVTSLEMSQDFQFSWPSTFYAHHIIRQGYTNRGQWLGAGMGTGGSSQYAEFTVYHPRGAVGVHLQRLNPDNDVLYARSVKTTDAGVTDPGRADAAWYQFKTSLVFGITGLYFVLPGFSISAEASYNLIINPTYENENYNNGPKWHNLRVALGLSYQL